ncbi:hypothetical protein VCCP1035_0118A, partial [Vibrio cholerae CP1035(8)]
MAEPNS